MYWEFEEASLKREIFQRARYPADEQLGSKTKVKGFTGMEISSLLYNIVLGMATLESRQRSLLSEYRGWSGCFGSEWCIRKTMGSGEDYWAVINDAGIICEGFTNDPEVL